MRYQNIGSSFSFLVFSLQFSENKQLKTKSRKLCGCLGVGCFGGSVVWCVGLCFEWLGWVMGGRVLCGSVVGFRVLL